MTTSHPPPTDASFPKNNIPLKAITYAFMGMPRMSSPHRDGWIWELTRDAIGEPTTAELFRRFMENFTNGTIPDSMWPFFASATLLPFHKLPQDKRNPTDPKLRPITIGSALSDLPAGYC